MEPGANRTAAHGVSEKYVGGGWTEYRGTEAALISAGVVKPEWLMRAGGKLFAVSRHKTLPDGRRVHLYRKGDLVRASIRVAFPEWREMEARERDAEEASKRQAQEERAAARAQRSVAGLPRSVDDYRAEAYRFADDFIGLTVFGTLRKGRGGYKFTRESFDRIMGAIDDFLEAVRTGEIEFSPTSRAQDETRIRAAELLHSPDFERFMHRATGE